MNIRPYTDLVPKTVTWFRDRADWGRQSPIVPSNPNAPLQFWADTTAIGAGGFNMWWQPLTARAYQFIAREANGRPKLCAIDSRQFFDTYGAHDALVRTYREFAFLFPQGVPYLEQVTVPISEAGTVNVEGGNGQLRDYPVEMLPSMMLVLTPTGEVGTVNYQEFASAMRGAARVTDDEKVNLIKGICGGTASPTDKIQAIRVIVQRQA